MSTNTFPRSKPIPLELLDDGICIFGLLDASGCITTPTLCEAKCSLLFLLTTVTILITQTIEARKNILHTTRMPETTNKLEFLNDLRKKYSYQPTFLQSVEEMAQSLTPVFEGENEPSLQPIEERSVGNCTTFSSR